MTQTITIGTLPMVPIDEYRRLQQENLNLKMEKEQLVMRMADLAIPTDYKEKLDKSLEELDKLRLHNEELSSDNKNLGNQIAKLREENAKLRIMNEQLRLENAELSKRVDNLQDSVKKLEASRIRESKIAIRTLLTDAKKRIQDRPDFFTENEMRLIASKKLKASVNIAAHVVTGPRILEAIDEMKADRELFRSIFKKTYNNEDEEDDDVDGYFS